MDFSDPTLIFLLCAYIGLGGVVGFCAGLLGIGGGIILVPSLYYFLRHFGAELHEDEAAMHIALATSMAIIFPTGLSSSWAQIKRGAVDWAAVKLLAPGLIVGALLGVVFVSRMDGEILQLIFAIGLCGIAISIFTKKEAGHAYPVLKKTYCAFPSSVLFGIAATLLGIGGAVLNIPYLNRAGWSLKATIASASVLGVIVTLPAIVGYVMAGNGTLGYIDPAAFLMIAPFSVMCAPLGVRASHALPVDKLRYMLALLLVVVAIKMAFEVV